jgi:hypothetical protein
MNKSLMTLEQSPLSKEIIQSYLLQLQKEPPSHHNNNFENIVKALIGKSQPKQAKIVFQTTFVDEKNNLTNTTRCSLFNKIMDIIQQKSDASGKIIEIDNYTQVQKPKPLGDNKNWRIVCTTKISYQELSDFIHTLNRKRSKSI